MMLLLTGAFVVLMAIGMPVAFATGISGFLFFFLTPGMPPSIGVQKVATMSQSFPLLAVPFFVLAGHLMNESGFTARLLGATPQPNNGQPINANAEVERRVGASKPAAAPKKSSGGWFDWL